MNQKKFTERFSVMASFHKMDNMILTATKIVDTLTAKNSDERVINHYKGTLKALKESYNQFCDKLINSGLAEELEIDVPGKFELDNPSSFEDRRKDFSFLH